MGSAGIREADFGEGVIDRIVTDGVVFARKHLQRLLRDPATKLAQATRLRRAGPPCRCLRAGHERGHVAARASRRWPEPPRSEASGRRSSVRPAAGAQRASMLRPMAAARWRAAAAMRCRLSDLGRTGVIAEIGDPFRRGGVPPRRRRRADGAEQRLAQAHRPITARVAAFRRATPRARAYWRRRRARRIRVVVEHADQAAHRRGALVLHEALDGQPAHLRLESSSSTVSTALKS